MSNGIQKYLTIALSAVFLWGISGPLYTQELKRTVLPMTSIELNFREGHYLINHHHAYKLDIVVQHLQHKPDMRILLKHTPTENEKIIKTRMQFIKAYLRDKAIQESRIVVSADRDVMCMRKCDSGIIITESQK